MSAPAAGIGIRDFARRDGCSDKLVREALKKGRLTAFSDGTLDPALVGTGWRKSARRSAEGAEESAAETADSPQSLRTATAEVSAVATQLANVLGIEPGDFMRDVLTGNFRDIASAEQQLARAISIARSRMLSIAGSLPGPLPDVGALDRT